MHKTRGDVTPGRNIKKKIKKNEEAFSTKSKERRGSKLKEISGGRGGGYRVQDAWARGSSEVKRG